MKKLLVCLIAVFAAAAAPAGDNGAWQITEVQGNEKSVVGYIYHTEAVGTQIDNKTEKFVTGLRLACSTSRNNPLVTIYWNTMAGSTTQYVQMHTDRNPAGLPLLRWDQEGSLLIRTIYESGDLIALLKNSNTITFTWISTGPVRRTTTFDLRDFKTHLNEFNTLCKSQI